MRVIDMEESRLVRILSEMNKTYSNFNLLCLGDTTIGVFLYSNCNGNLKSLRIEE